MTQSKHSKNTPKLGGTQAKDTNGEIKNGSPFFSFLKKHPTAVVAVIALILLGGLYLWMDYQNKKDRNAIIGQVESKVAEKNEEMLRLITRPMVWSIRSEIMRGNLDQISIFTADLVRERNFEYIHVIDDEGQIIVSTDKKREGEPVGAVIDRGLTLADNTRILHDDNSLMVVAPVMGYDKRLGTLVISYKPESFILNQKG